MIMYAHERLDKYKLTLCGGYDLEEQFCLFTFWHPREGRITALHVETPVTGVAEQHVVLYSTDTQGLMIIKGFIQGESQWPESRLMYFTWKLEQNNELTMCQSSHWLNDSVKIKPLVKTHSKFSAFITSAKFVS